jgi:hypothetical protein
MAYLFQSRAPECQMGSYVELAMLCFFAGMVVGPSVRKGWTADAGPPPCSNHVGFL